MGILKSQGLSNIYLLVLALADGCPITYINEKAIVENVADGYISGSSGRNASTKAVLGHPSTLRSGK